ncbi:MAG TPA: pseudouridine-5'-phosphate glycosidase [Chloroflexia bacterium]|nr:pseudouridine-5'-phosphate glycosidase [Chloroflexia bacterium]
MLGYTAAMNHAADESLFVVADEVAAGVAAGQPVVALESTVIAHGLPWPRNLEVAAACQDAVRAAGAVPATIAVFGGRIHVGCDMATLERLATASDIAKLSIRDLALVRAAGGDGATTVASTLYLASIAPHPIAVFATGGVGGVHRGWERTLDISADLPTLAASALVTVCAGAKSILDLPATREWLETHGVTVLGWQTDEFPAFYSRESGLPVDARVEDAAAVAGIVRAGRALGLPGGVLLTVPIPAEAAIPAAEIDSVLQAALQAATAAGAKGKALTPFLLSYLHRESGGRSLNSNAALLIHNAAVAGQVAVALAS